MLMEEFKILIIENRSWARPSLENKGWNIQTRSKTKKWCERGFGLIKRLVKGQPNKDVIIDGCVGQHDSGKRGTRAKWL